MSAKPRRVASERRRRRRAGLSLVELVTVIAVSGVLTVGLASLLRMPMQGYLAVSRRAELVALADLTVSRMSRDLRTALPNSVRIAGGNRILELMTTSAGGRYRVDPGVNDPGGPSEVDHSAASDWLSFGGDDRFNVLGRFASLAFTYGTPLANGTRLAIYPTGVDVWSEAATGADPGVITPNTTSITILDDGDEDQLVLGASHRFSLASPTARLFVVDGPTTYLCDVAAGVLWRVDGYAATAGQPTSISAAPLSGGNVRRVADQIESCAFDYVPGNATRAGLVTIEIVLAAADERVRLLQQVQVQNAP